LAVSKILAKRMGKIVFPDDGLQDAPPPLKTSVNELPMTGDIIRAVLATAGLPLFGVASVHQEVEVHEVEITHGSVRSGRDIMVQPGGVLCGGDPRLEESDAPGR